MSTRALYSGRRFAVLCAVLAMITGLPGLALGRETNPGNGVAGAPYEVWVVDQQDTRDDGGGRIGGGLIYIYDGPKLAGNAEAAVPEVLDLGDEVFNLCVNKTGSAPRRPHMLTFNGGDYDLSAAGNAYALLAFVVSGHVVLFDAASRAPLDCIDVGEQAHAVWPTPTQTHALVANQNGRLLQRIATDYTAGTLTLEEDATLNLATCVTPSNQPCTIPGLRDDNAPICTRVDALNRYTFANLRGGGFFVIDHNATPMRIVGEYDRTSIWTGCGAAEVGDKLYVNSGSLPARPSGNDVYVFDMDEFSLQGTPPNTPTPKVVYSRTPSTPGETFDSHGVALTKGQRYLWINDRIQNDITVVDTETDTVANRFTLEGELSSDPAPDIFDLSPSGNRMFVTLRGPEPQSGGHAAVGNTPGLGVIQVTEGGRSGELIGIARLPAPAPDTAPDPHGVRVRHIRGR